MPNLVLEKEEKIILNKYGRLRLKFLKENKKAEYTIMFMNGTLNNHLKEIQETAEEKVNLIVEQLKKENNLTEKMKNTKLLIVIENKRRGSYDDKKILSCGYRYI